MPEPRSPLWESGLFRRPLRQPDQRSCGAAVLVVAQALHDPAYAALVGAEDGFRSEVLGMHRRVTSPVDVGGRAQLPWPRTWGTPPWAVARQLEGRTGLDHGLRLLRGDRECAYAELVAAPGEGHPVPMYVGSGWLPRHVVLVLGGSDTALRAYEPARGTVVTVPRAAFLDGALGLAGWDTPWFSVPPRARRTPA